MALGIEITLSMPRAIAKVWKLVTTNFYCDGSTGKIIHANGASR